MNAERDLTVDKRSYAACFSDDTRYQDRWGELRHCAANRRACHIVSSITKEMAYVAGDRVAFHKERRRPYSHFRQIAMYVCHVTLQLSLSEIGQAFGRDRTTVAYSCRVIEDRRDDRSFDEFIASVERLALSVVTTAEVRSDG